MMMKEALLLIDIQNIYFTPGPMLLEQLREFISFGLVEKKTFEGYPLRVEYSISERRGRKMIEAIDIMQMIGVDYMLEKGMTDALISKGVLSEEKVERLLKEREACSLLMLQNKQMM